MALVPMVVPMDSAAVMVIEERRGDGRHPADRNIAVIHANSNSCGDGRHPADRNIAAIHANSNSSKEAAMIIIANVSQEEEELCLDGMGIKDTL